MLGLGLVKGLGVGFIAHEYCSSIGKTDGTEKGPGKCGALGRLFCQERKVPLGRHGEAAKRLAREDATTTTMRGGKKEEAT